MKNLQALLTILICISTAYAQDNIKAYANFDFVPGDKIIFEDDFLSDTDGEYPAHWTLESGQAVVNKLEGKSAFVFTEGSYAMSKPAMKEEKKYLAESFTLEFDFFYNEGNEAYVFFRSNEETPSISFGNDVVTGYFNPELRSSYPNGYLSRGWHHASLAYKNGQIKCYVDQYRILVVPKCGFVPDAILMGGIGSLENPVAIANVRLAAGGGMNMLNKILTDGKLITYGITFDVNKATLRPESMGTLNEISKLMKEKPDLKFEVGGHTDSDGEDSHNMKLSQQRAEAVKTALTTLGISSDRLTSKGYGETKPIDSNSSREGKANNRRVEFTKI